MPKVFLGAAVIYALTNLDAAASTITVQTQSLGINNQVPAHEVTCTESTSALVASCWSSNGTIVDNGVVSGQGYASVDAETGIIKLNTKGSARTAAGVARIHPLAIASITETFEVFGTVTFGLEYRGYWDVRPVSDGYGSWTRGEVDLLFQMLTPFGERRYQSTSREGEVDDEFSLSFHYASPRTIDVTWITKVQMLDGAGFADFGHTGFLFMSAEEGSFIRPTNEKFLAEQAYGSVVPVPLPASLAFAISGLGGLSLLRRRRRIAHA